MSGTGTLSLKPVSAQLTHDTEVFGKMDPYCIVKIGNQEQRTRVHHDAGKFPQWQECFSFRIQYEDMVNFILWDKDTMSKDDMIAEGSISLASLKKPGKSCEYVQLSFKGKLAGKIYIEAEWFPDKTDEPKQQQAQQLQQPQQPQIIFMPGMSGCYPSMSGYPPQMPYQQQPMYAQPPPFSQSTYSPYQQPPYQQTPYQQPPYQQPPYQQPPYSQSTYQQPPPMYPPQQQGGYPGGNSYGPPQQQPMYPQQQQKPYGY